MKTVLEYKQRYANLWHDKPESYWLARLLQEVGELADTFTEETKDTRRQELTQIASICLNWLDVRGEWVEEDGEE